MHEQFVADYARVFGPDHAETVTARSNLAYAYQLAGDLARAIPLHRQVLAGGNGCTDRITTKRR